MAALLDFTPYTATTTTPTTTTPATTTPATSTAPVEVHDGPAAQEEDTHEMQTALTGTAPVEVHDGPALEHHRHPLLGPTAGARVAAGEQVR